MSILELHAITTQLIASGHGALSVDISKTTFTHPLENDGATIMPVESAKLEHYELMDDNA